MKRVTAFHPRVGGLFSIRPLTTCEGNHRRDGTPEVFVAMHIIDFRQVDRLWFKIFESTICRNDRSSYSNCAVIILHVADPALSSGRTTPEAALIGRVGIVPVHAKAFCARMEARLDL